MLLTVKAQILSPEVEPGNEPVSDGVPSITGVTGYFESRKQKILNALENISKMFFLFTPPSSGSWCSFSIQCELFKKSECWHRERPFAEEKINVP